MAGWRDGLLIRVNPNDRKGQTMAKKKNKKKNSGKPAAKKSGKPKKKNPSPAKSAKKSRKRRNPGEVEKAKKAGLQALALAGGALAVEAVDKLLVPMEYRSGIMGSLVRAGTSVGLGFVAEHVPVKAISDHADEVRTGGLAMTAFLFGAEKILPMIPSDVVVGKLLGMSSAPVEGRLTFQRERKPVAGRLTFQRERAGVGSIGGGGAPGSAGAPWARRSIA